MDVKHLCLGVLYAGPSSGYDIKKYFESSFKHIFVAGFGSIYPALSGLLEKGFVRAETHEQDRLPDKKLYFITETGREAFEQAPNTSVPRHKVRSEFLVMMHFAHLLPVTQVSEAIDMHLSELEQLYDTLEMAAEENADVSLGSAFARDYSLASTRASILYVRKKRRAFLRNVRKANKSRAA